jgi:hypothetical protein
MEGLHSLWFVLPRWLALLAGTVIATVLVIRRRSLPAVLALVGFGSMLLLSIVGSVWDLYLIDLFIETESFVQFGIGFRLIRVGSSLCCSTLVALSYIALIVGLWKAVTGGATGSAGREDLA